MNRSIEEIRKPSLLKPGKQLRIGPEVLCAEIAEEQITNPPSVDSFSLPAPNEHVDDPRHITFSMNTSNIESHNA
jgi:hypothetical protein